MPGERIPVGRVEDTGLALFGKKKVEGEAEDAGNAREPEKRAESGGEGAAGPVGAGVKYVVNPEKAAKFFDYARTLHDSTNFEYAMVNWLNGVRQDPTSLRGLEGFFASAAEFRDSKKRPSKDTLKQFSGRGDLEKYLLALIDWGMEPLEASAAVRAADAASRLNLAEPTYWIGQRALNAVAKDKRPRKDLYVRLKDCFQRVQAWDMAVKAGEAAVRVDPTDGQLAAEIRNLSAQATMSAGGYDRTGQAGGFRANVRDAERQRQLDEQERIVKSEDTLDRLVRMAEEDYAKRPQDPHAITLLGKRLMERGRPEDEKRAYQIFMKGFDETRQFRFREQAGDIKLRVMRRQVQARLERAEASPGDGALREEYEKVRTQLLEAEIAEYKLRVEAYPTDLGHKFELGKRCFELGRFDEAIPLFQESRNEAKRRVESLNFLAQAFHKAGYTDEAIHTYRQALEAHQIKGDELSLALRYGLMTALHQRARDERDLSAAEEADRLASAITIEQFNYRDVRTRRDDLKKLIAELRRGAPA